MNDITALNGLSNSIREWNTFSNRAICANEYKQYDNHNIIDKSYRWQNLFVSFNF